MRGIKLKKLILFIALIFISISSAQAEQWIYIKTIHNISDTAAIMLDLDSIQFDESDNSVTFNIKKDEQHYVYIHKMKYLYKTKQFATIESTKYLSWIAPENKIATQTFENPTYQLSRPNSLSDRIETIISNKKNIDYIKNYADDNKKLLEKKLAKSLKNIDEANILFWIDGTGKLYSYEYMFGNYDDSLTANILNKNDDKISYSIIIQCYPKTEKGKSSAIDIYKKTYNPTTKKTSFSSKGEIISPIFIQRAMIPNMPSIAKIAYEAQMQNPPASSYGTLSNKDFFETFISTMNRQDLQDRQKMMAIQLFGIQSLNYNEELNKQLKEIKGLKKFSDSYTKGVVGILINLK